MLKFVVKIHSNYEADFITELQFINSIFMQTLNHTYTLTNILHRIKAW